MRVRMIVLGLAVGILLPLPALADVCVKPPTPACLDDGTTFVAAERMIDCQVAAKRYIDDTMDYTKCLGEEVRRTNGDLARAADLNNEVTRSGEEMTRAVNRFNCRLSGRQDCR